MKVTLTLSLQDVNRDLLQGLSGIMEKHPGKDSIIVKVIEHTEQIDVLMRNKVGGISADKEVLNSLGKFGEVTLNLS